jgi:hypothetical protein
MKRKKIIKNYMMKKKTNFNGSGCETKINMNRRELLRYAGAGLLAGVFSGSVGKVLAASLPGNGEVITRSNVSVRTPISLIIDDGSPVDPLFYELPGYETPFLVPAEFTRRVADTFDKYDLRGKFTVIPMPSCLGRIDQSLQRVPQAHLQEFLKLVRERIAPRFDITPEFLTHLCTYDLKTGNYRRHLFEDTWISQASLEEIVEYFTLAFQILKNVGLEATGITSPWVSGIDVEEKYAHALAEAQWNVFKRKLTWYFLHAASDTEEPIQCAVKYKNNERGQVVISVPSNAGDIFWCMEKTTHDERVKFINEGIDRLVSPDGKSGRIRQLMDTGFPVVLVTHWQSLYTQGTGLGLEGLSALSERIQKVFGSSLEWVTCSELARRYANSV